MGKHLCSGCSEAIYCSKECQKAHWVMHKTTCQTAVKPSAVTSFDSLSAKQLKNILKVKAATLDETKRKKIMDQSDRIVEKPQLVKLVDEYVKLSEVESLLSAADEKAVAASSASSSSSAAKSSASKKAKETKNYPPTPTPEQMRQQAAAIKQNPAMVRRANPAFAAMTDEQIRQYAEQLEVAASDPNMMKEVERMSRMSPAEREQLQIIQEGMQGLRKMDDAWVNSLVTTLKKNPDFFKTMVRGKSEAFGGVSEESVMSFIDTVSTMDEKTLRNIMKVLLYLSTWSKPLNDLYTTVDKATLGSARFIFMGLALTALYMTVMWWVKVVSWVLFKLTGWPAPVAQVTGAAAALAGKVAQAAGGVTTTLPTVAKDAVAAAGAGLAATAAAGSATAAAEALVGAAAAAATTKAAGAEASASAGASAGAGAADGLAGPTAAAVAADGEAADVEFD